MEGRVSRALAHCWCVVCGAVCRVAPVGGEGLGGSCVVLGWSLAVALFLCRRARSVVVVMRGGLVCLSLSYHLFARLCVARVVVA